MNGQHIVELLFAHARQAPDELAYIFVGDDHTERRLTRAQLCEQIRRIAANLLRHCAAGERVAIQLPQDEGYVTVFWACLYAGLVPVPLYPSSHADVRRRLAVIVADSGATIAVCAAADGSPGQVELAALTVDAEPAAAADVTPATLAYLQYSSGSTGTPKGVMISHANIMANLAMIARSAGVRGDDVFVTWLPLHHDLGLVNTVLLPVATGCLSVIGTPLSFMRNPLSWPARMARYGGTISGGPNFAYQTVVDRLRSRGERGAALLAELDLHRWRVAFNAAEPIQTATLEAFAAAFRSAGFADGAFFAAYGMAEATVFVSGASWNREREAAAVAGRAGAVSVAGTIGCGAAGAGAGAGEVLVVDAHGQPLALGVEGEIWIRGPHVSTGYFGQADDPQSPFRRYSTAGEGPFFATGDSGVVEHGQLYVLGRIKDILIQNGRNLYPTDLEQVIKRVLNGDNRYAGFAVVGKRQGGTEAVVLVLEARPTMLVDDAELFGRISSSVFEGQGVLLDSIVVVPQGTITKTSSGKVRRQALRLALEAGEFEARRFQVRPDDAQGEVAADPALEAQLATLLSTLTGQDVDNPHRSFFAYGISSLQIYELAAELAERFRVALSVRDVFEHPTLRRLGNLLCTASKARAAPAGQGGAVLSANQQMMLAIDAWSPANPAYHLPLVLALDGGVDPVRLAHAAEQALMRHDILRTVYVLQDDGRYGPTVLSAAGFGIAVERIEPDQRAHRLNVLTCQSFDLGRDYPVRGHVLAGAAGGEVVLALVIHHIAADGWSLRLLAEQILRRYGGAATLEEAVPAAFSSQPVLPSRYQAALGYWKNALAGLPDVHSLPLDAARASARGRNAPGARHEIRLAPAVVDAFKTLCADQHASLFNGVHALLALALARTGNQTDVVLGTFLSGRDSAERLAQVGFLAQTTLLRTKLELSTDTASLIRQCRDTLQDAHRHIDVSYLDLLRELKPVRDPSYNPLFQISLNYHDYGGAEALAGGMPARFVAVDAGVARYDLSVDVYPEDSGLRLCFEYDTTLFEAGTIARLAAFWDTLLASALAAPDAPVGGLRGHDVPALPAPSGADVSLYRRFRAVADTTPDAIAVRYQQQSLTYRQLSEEVDRLVAGIARTVVAGDRVLIFMHRTPAYVVAILAILQLDCTYVPLDPDYYQDAVAERIRFIAPAAVLVDACTQPALPATGIDVPVIAVAPGAEAPAGAAAPVQAHGRHPAYILFTSGSTGSPKAVSMGHGALDNLIAEISSTIDDTPPVVLNYSSIAFDMHFTEVFTALFNGGTVVLADAAMRRNTLALLRLLADEGVNLLNLSYPVLCELALGAEQADIRLPALRTVLSTAQQLKITPGLRTFFERHPAAVLFNHYGPTETHVVTVAALGNSPADWPDVPDIGKPIRHTACFVLNASGVPEAPGAIGELYVAGLSLAEGYYANPAMTAERFVHLDVGAGQRMRAYRTGDFVRIRNDGSLQYFGRRDHEIKIRGLRVDLSDIEASIQRCAGVAQAMVVARQLGGGMRILAYVQRDGSALCSEAIIAAALRQSLPAYMVPDHIVLVDGFQLNQNGKIDLAQLPEPAERQRGQDEPARSAHETVVYEIWRNVLGHDGFGRSTSFFEAGGDSLALMAVKRELDLRYSRDIDLVDIYGSPTVAALAALIAGTRQEGHGIVPRLRKNLNTARRQRLESARMSVDHLID